MCLSLQQRREVRKIDSGRLADLNARIVEMNAMAGTLRRLVHACHGDNRPDCPIFEDFAAKRN